MEMSHRGSAAISIILGKLWDIIWNEIEKFLKEAETYKEDIVVYQDYGVAAMALGKGR